MTRDQLYPIIDEVLSVTSSCGRRSEVVAVADDIVQRIRENLPCIEWEQPLAAERERLAADEIVRLRAAGDRLAEHLRRMKEESE